MVRNGGLPFIYNRKRNARFGLLRRDATDASGIQWFEMNRPLMIFHTANAWQEGDEVKLYACTFENVCVGVVYILWSMYWCMYWCMYWWICGCALGACQCVEYTPHTTHHTPHVEYTTHLYPIIHHALPQHTHTHTSKHTHIPTHTPPNTYPHSPPPPHSPPHSLTWTWAVAPPKTPLSGNNTSSTCMSMYSTQQLARQAIVC